MNIHIENLKFKCIIGILDFERTKKQNVIVNIKIKYDFLNTFINYADVTEVIEKTMKKKKFLLIEDALEFLSKKLKNNFKAIYTLKIKITKPSILPNCRVSVENKYKFNS